MSVELAKRAVACKAFRWMGGMLVHRGQSANLRVDRVSGDRVYLTDKYLRVSVARHLCLSAPLTDPATLGCLMELVREAWGIETAHLAFDCSRDGGWYVGDGLGNGIDGSGMVGVFDTKSEAAVVALEAAP